MIKKIERILIIVALLLASVTVIQAQKINNTLYMMQSVPQSHYVNPAIQPECKYFIGVPLLSSIYANYSNGGFSYNDLIKEGTGLKKDSLVIDVNSFHDALKTTNFGSIETDYSILAFGIRHKNYYFTFDIINKTDIRGNFDKEMITFLKNGNAGYKGKTSDWGNYNFDGFLYNEIAFGASKKINDKWTVGAKLKVLAGLANAHLKKSNIAVATSETGDMVTLYSKQRLLVSLPLQIKDRSDGTVEDVRFNQDDYNADFYTNTSNLGFAVDLGMTYQVNSRTSLYASILDLGAITWKDNLTELVQDTEFKWKGSDWSQSGNSKAPDYKEIESVFESLVDSLKQDIYADTITREAYTTALPSKIYMGVSHQVSDRLSLGALFRTTLYNGKALPSITLSGNSRLKKWLSASVSYTVANNSYTNIGMGLAARMGVAQFYFVTDNILAGIDPNSARLANFRFGVNILLGCPRKRAESNSCTIEEENRYKKEKYRKRRR